MSSLLRLMPNFVWQVFGYETFHLFWRHHCCIGHQSLKLYLSTSINLFLSHFHWQSVSMIAPMASSLAKWWLCAPQIVDKCWCHKTPKSPLVTIKILWMGQRTRQFSKHFRSSRKGLVYMLAPVAAPSTIVSFPNIMNNGPNCLLKTFGRLDQHAYMLLQSITPPTSVYAPPSLWKRSHPRLLKKLVVTLP